MGIINLFGAAQSAGEMAELKLRKNRLIPLLREQIEREGGEVQKVRSLNSRLIVRSPFPQKLVRINSTDGRPVLLQLMCNYPNDDGDWFIYAPSSGPVRWVWKSTSQKDVPPVSRSEHLTVKNNVLTFPFWAGALLYLGLIAAAISAVLLFFGQRRS